MIAKTQDEIKNLRAAGKMLAESLEAVAKLVAPGVTTAALDLAAQRFIEERGGKPAFLGYKPDGAPYPFPATLCVSIDDEVVHGIPRETRALKAGELVMLDLGLSVNGFFSDMAVTVPVGEANSAGKKLIDAAREALSAAIKVARPGARMGDIGAAIEAVAKKYNLGVVEDLGGHGLGRVPHEKPYVPNAGRAGEGEKLVEGMVLAIEPIFTEGRGDIVLAEDGWTYLTADHSRSAEFEHTVLITKDGADTLTLL